MPDELAHATMMLPAWASTDEQWELVADLFDPLGRSTILPSTPDLTQVLRAQMAPTGP